MATSLLKRALPIVIALFVFAGFTQKEALGEEVKEFQVTAKVINVDTGKPIAGIPYNFNLYQDRKSLARKVVVTDDDGLIKLTIPNKPKLRLYLSLKTPIDVIFDYYWMDKNRARYVNLTKVGPGMDDIEFKVKLIPSYKLTGTVLDGQGKPSGGAKIYYDQNMAAITTNNDGVFDFNTAPADRDFDLLVVSTDKSEAKIVKVTKGTASLNVKLVPTFNVKGKIVAGDGKPAAKLRFRANFLINNTSIYKMGGNYTSDENGVFEIKNACQGTTLTASWYSSSGTNVNFWSGNQALSLKQGKPAILKVKRFIDDWDAPDNIAKNAETKCKKLSNYCLDPQDNILACDEHDKVIRKISPEDKLLDTWNLEFAPQAIDCKADGTVIVAGPGKIAILDKSGKVTCQSDMAGSAASGIGFTKNEIFAAIRERTGFAILRMTDKLQQQKVIVTKLSGCCGQFDITARGDYIYAAANTKFRINKYDRQGKLVLEMGEKGKSVEKGFNGCCEPKNVCFDKKGDLYASESGNCCVKRFSADGKSFELLGKVSGIRGCVRVSIAINSKGDKAYMLDTKRSIIRCMPITPKTTKK
ncbi:MAG: hypothetical protein FVQ82_03800 [Planctomycetes bacterium]|nr:hypothetical protein [Planctomycetota bacterium]